MTEKKLVAKEIDSAKIKMVVVSDGVMKIGVGQELVTVQSPSYALLVEARAVPEDAVSLKINDELYMVFCRHGVDLDGLDLDGLALAAIGAITGEEPPLVG